VSFPLSFPRLRGPPVYAVPRKPHAVNIDDGQRRKADCDQHPGSTEVTRDYTRERKDNASLHARRQTGRCGLNRRNWIFPQMRIAATMTRSSHIRYSVWRGEPSNCKVRVSGSPAKYFFKASLKTLPAGAASRNNVIDDLNFIASTGPKIRSAERLSTAFTSSVHRISLGPRTACAGYASASARDEIANRCDIALLPR